MGGCFCHKPDEEAGMRRACGIWRQCHMVGHPDANPGFGASRYSLGSKVFNHLISWEIPSLQNTARGQSLKFICVNHFFS